LLHWVLGHKSTSCRERQPQRFRPWVECLEGRLAPATFNLAIDPAVNQGGAISELIGDIITANANGQVNTLNLFPGATYQLVTITPNNFWYGGPNALPAISSTLTINGQGATLTPPPLFGAFSTSPAASKACQRAI
jgi:hypothetical protein